MRIITGRASKDIDAPVLNRIRELKSADPLAPVIVITMRQATFITEKYILSRLGVQGMLGLEVLSFDKLEQKLVENVFGRALDTLDAAGRCMLFCYILSEHGKELQKLSTSGRRPDISKGLSDLYTEFADMDIAINELKRYSEEDEVFGDKLAEISSAFEIYDEWCDRHVKNTFDRTSIAIEAVKKSEYIKQSHIFVMGCDVLTEQMVRFLLELDEYAKSLTAAFLFSKEGRDSDVFTIPERYIHDLGCMGNVTIETAEDEKGRSSDLAHMEKNLFAYPYEKTVSKGDVSVIKCADPADEVMACCERVAELIDSGYKPSDIAVVAPGISAYSKYIKKCFGDSLIPYFLDEKRTLAENALADFILSALKLLRGRLTTEKLLIHLRTGFLGTPEETDIISAYIRGYVKNAYKLRNELDDARTEAARKACLQPVFDFIARAKKCTRQRALLTALQDYVRSCNAAGRITRMSEEQKAFGYDDAADYYAQVADEITEVFGQLKILAEGKADSELLEDMLKSALENHTVSIIPVRSEAVFFGDINQAKVHAVKCLLIMGANEGQLPDYEEEAGLLTYDEKNSIYLGLRERSYPSALTKQKLFLYEMITAPADRLEMFYHESDGKDLTPESVFVTKIKDMFTSGLSDLKGNEIIGRSLMSNAVDRAKAAVGRMITVTDTEEDRQKLSEVMSDGEAEKELRAFYELGGIDVPKSIDPVTAAALYPDTGSVTRFEEFFNCPYLFFLGKGIKPDDEKNPDMRANEEGDFIHNMLDRFFKRAKEKASNIRDMSMTDIADITDSIAKELAEESPKELDDGDSLALVSELKSEVDEYLGFLKQEKSVSVSDVELTEQKYDMELGGSRLTGRIDRVDTCVVNGQRYFSVTDYKTGKTKDFTLYDIYKGLMLQVVVYLAAAGKLMPDAKPAGAGYVHIDPSGALEDKEKEISFPAKGLHIDDQDVIKAMYGLKEDEAKKVPGLGIRVKNDGKLYKAGADKLLSEADMDLIKRFAAHKVREASDKIKEGVIAAEPAQKRNGSYPCRYCRFNGICPNPLEDNSERNVDSKEELLSKMAEEVADDE